MKIISTTFVLLFFSIAAAAANVSGVVYYNQDNKPCVQLNGYDYKLKLKTFSRSVAEALSNLHPGDYISGDGRVSISTGSVTLYSIDYVGLKRILGQWIAPNNDVFYFKTFRSLEMRSGQHSFQSLKNSPNDFARGSNSKSGNITYQLGAKTGESGWPMLLLSRGGTSAGELVVESSDRLRLYIIDARSGESVEYQLRPLNPAGR